MKHLCIKIKEENQDVAYCVNQQQKGVKGMFDNTLEECEDLNSVDIDAHIKALIDDRNNGEEEIMRLIDEKKINKSGFANQDDALWLTIGTYDDLIKEVEQEIEYQKEHREKEEKAVKKYLSEIGKRGGKKGGSSRTPKKSASSAANLDRARAEGKTGGYPAGRKRGFFMNPATGSVDDYDGWWYETEGGEKVNAVDRGEVVRVVKDKDGNWIEK